MNTYTPQEKKEYFAKLRASWQVAKDLAKTNEWAAAFKEAQATGIQCSVTGFVFTKLQMEQMNLDGTPYVDCKTFAGWKSAGFMVKKGETSKIQGLTWVSSKTKKEDEDGGFVFPKAYHLFHKTQVQEIMPMQGLKNEIVETQKFIEKMDQVIYS